MWKSLVVLFWSMIAPAEGQVIKNPEKVVGNAMTLTFRQDLVIGPEGGTEHHIWSGATVGFDVDAKGNIFVSDTGGNRIIQFDADGNFIRQIGREGSGPGEFQGLYSIHKLADGSTVSYENNQNRTAFQYFDSEMNFISKVIHQPGPTKDFIQSMTIAPSGKLFAVTGAEVAENTGKPKQFRQGVVDQNFQYLLIVSSHDRPQFEPEKARDSGWWSDFLGKFLKISLDGAGHMAFDQKGNVFISRPGKYEIDVYDGNLNKKFTIQKEYTPKIRTEKELESWTEPIHDELSSLVPSSLATLITTNVIAAALNKAALNPTHPPIQGLIPLENGSLLVISFIDVENHQMKVDIFDGKGGLLGQATLPPIETSLNGTLFGAPSRFLFKNGFAYGAVPNEDNEYQIVRYRYQLVPASR